MTSRSACGALSTDGRSSWTTAACYLTTEDDVVTLSLLGHHKAVVSATWMAPGVTDVRDDILITY
jgi:hypothetical protein